MKAGNKQLSSALVVLTLGYFAIELILNTTIYGMLGYSNDVLFTSSMELWGKVIAGIGMALIATRMWISTRAVDAGPASTKNTYKAFLVATVFAIPLSFFIQDRLVLHVLKSSNIDEFNKAVLINEAHNTLVPMYKFEGMKKNAYEPTLLEDLFYPLSGSNRKEAIQFKKNKDFEVAVRGQCADKSAKLLGAESRLERAFFPYKATLAGFDENLYKQAIKEHYICAYNNDAYFDERTKDNINQIDAVNKFFDEYYLPNALHYQTYSKTKPSNAKKEWREKMNAIYGFKTTIQPDNQGYFLNHADTKRLYAARTGLTEVYPGDENFKEDGRALIVKGLPNSVLGGAYQNQAGNKDPLPNYMTKPAEYAGTLKGITKTERIQISVANYKSIMMPIIALGLSAFFLILNIILSVGSVVSWIANKRGWHPMLGEVFIAIALVWFLLWPITKGGDEYAAFEESKYPVVAKWLYYHEGNLISLYEIVLKGDADTDLK